MAARPARSAACSVHSVFPGGKRSAQGEKGAHPREWWGSCSHQSHSFKFLIRTQNWDASCPCPQGSVGTVSLQNMGAALVGSQEDSDSRGLSFPKMGTCQKVFM